MPYRITISQEIIQQIHDFVSEIFDRKLNLNKNLTRANKKINKVFKMIAPEMAEEGEVITLLLDSSSLLYELYTNLLFSFKTPPKYVSRLSSKLCTEETIKNISDDDYDSIKKITGYIINNYKQVLNAITKSISDVINNTCKQVLHSTQKDKISQAKAWNNTKGKFFKQVKKVVVRKPNTTGHTANI